MYWKVRVFRGQIAYYPQLGSMAILKPQAKTIRKKLPRTKGKTNLNVKPKSFLALHPKKPIQNRIILVINFEKWDHIIYINL